MNFRMESPEFAWLEQYLWLLLPLIFLGVMWSRILQTHKKYPLSSKMMAALITYTAMDLLLLIPGVLCAFAFLIAFFCLTFTFCSYIHNWLSKQRDQRCTAYTKGTVSNLRLVKSRNRVRYFPTIVFYADGERYSAESNVSCSREELGKTCWVKYNPNDPHEITQEQYENSEARVLLAIEIMLLFVAVICLIVGISEIVSMLSS